jgi:hypothetical protein
LDQDLNNEGRGTGNREWNVKYQLASKKQNRHQLLQYIECNVANRHGKAGGLKREPWAEGVAQW